MNDNFKKGSEPYTVVGVPHPSSGIRLVPPEELFQRAKDNPGFRDAIDRIEKRMGKPSGIKVALHRELVHDAAVANRIRSNKKVIDYAAKKAAGKIKGF